MYVQPMQRQGVGFLPGAAIAASAGLGPVGVAFVIGVSVVGLYETFKDWFQRGELKVAATATAEQYVDSVWGTRSPNSPPTEDSVSKLIEACQLDAAQEMINFLARQMYEKASKDSYFDRWMKEWGFLTLTQIQNKLTAYRGYCAVAPEPTLEPELPIITSPPELPPAIEPTTGAYIPLSQARASKTGLLSLAALAFAALVISRS